MADTKISDLPPVTSALATDEFVLARAGTTNKITAADLFSVSAFTKIGQSILGSSASSIGLASIPATATDLIIEGALRGTSTNQNAYIQFNGDTSAIYDYSQDVSVNSSTAAQGAAAQTGGHVCSYPQSADDANRFGTMSIRIPGYTRTDRWKSYQSLWSDMRAAGTLVQGNSGGLWRSTVAIDEITIIPDTGQFAAGSMITVYLLG